MSNILKSQDDLIVFSDIIKYANKNELSKDFLEELLQLLIPQSNGENLIDYKVKARGRDTAKFSPRFHEIGISLSALNQWLENNVKDFAELYDIKDMNTLKSFLCLFVISHEVEHSYQYLMGEGIIEAPSKIIQSGYKELVDLFLPDTYIIPRPIKEVRQSISLLLYKMKQNFYILERNANIEASDLLSQVATYMEREDMLEMFNQMKSLFMRIGYTENPNGSLEETYKKILLYDRYRKFLEETNMSEKEKARFGLKITEQTRQKVLKER